MKLLVSDEGRVTYLFPVEEMRPPNGLQMSEFLAATKERYQFQWAPTTTIPFNEFDGKPLEFRHGKIDASGVLANVLLFNIYTDGIAASCHATEPAEIFLRDFMEWGVARFGFRQPQRQIKSLFSSSVVVQSEFDLDQVLEPWKKISDLIASSYANFFDEDSELHLMSLIFGRPPFQSNAGFRPEFMLERRVNSHLPEQRYFSKASIPTPEHLKLLAKLESLIESKHSK